MSPSQALLRGWSPAPLNEADPSGAAGIPVGRRVMTGLALGRALNAFFRHLTPLHGSLRSPGPWEGVSFR